MKKLTLKTFNLGETLSRDQMKKVTGGVALTCGQPGCGSEKLCIAPDSGCESGCGYYCSTLCHTMCAII